MESMKENKPLLYSLVATGSFIALLALGWSPELCEQFAIIDFPDDVSIFFKNIIRSRLILFIFFPVPQRLNSSFSFGLLPVFDH